jgi:hypothetical protein
VTDDGEVLCGVLGTKAGVVLTEGDVERPVQLSTRPMVSCEGMPAEASTNCARNLMRDSPKRWIATGSFAPQITAHRHKKRMVSRLWTFVRWRIGGSKALPG